MLIFFLSNLFVKIDDEAYVILMWMSQLELHFQGQIFRSLNLLVKQFFLFLHFYNAFFFQLFFFG